MSSPAPSDAGSTATSSSGDAPQIGQKGNKAGKKGIDAGKTGKKGNGGGGKLADSRVKTMMQSASRELASQQHKQQLESLIQRLRDDPDICADFDAMVKKMDRDTSCRIELDRNKTTVGGGSGLPDWLKLKACKKALGNEQGECLALEGLKRTQIAILFEYLCSYQAETKLVTKCGLCRTWECVFALRIINGETFNNIAFVLTSVPDMKTRWSETWNHLAGRWKFSCKEMVEDEPFFFGMQHRMSATDVRFGMGLKIAVKKTMGEEPNAVLEFNQSSLKAVLKVKSSGMQLPLSSLLNGSCAVQHFEPLVDMVCSANEYSVVNGLCANDDFNIQQHINSAKVLNTTNTGIGETTADVVFAALCPSLGSPDRKRRTIGQNTSQSPTPPSPAARNLKTCR